VVVIIDRDLVIDASVALDPEGMEWKRLLRGPPSGQHDKVLSQRLELFAFVADVPDWVALEALCKQRPVHEAAARATGRWEDAGSREEVHAPRTRSG